MPADRPGIGAAVAVALLAAAFVFGASTHREPAAAQALAPVSEPIPPGAAAASTMTDVEQMAQPRADLTAKELAAFNEGKKLFVQKPPGLGPLFNAERCSDCHFTPTLGGNAGVDVLRHAAFVAPDRETGDAVPYQSHALPGWTVPTPPANASRRIPPPLYGLGLIERIPDETIRAACGTGHPDRAKFLGSMPRNTVSRFGAKPFVGTIPDFVDSALQSEIGATTPIDQIKDDDAFPDPEVDREYVETLAAFVRGLPPPPRNGTDAAGASAFQTMGCATCHVPDMHPAIGVFSDLCVHRMGNALADGISDKEAKGDEFRTTPLWGLRFRNFFLHDGRAASLEDAIKMHAGEADHAARAFRDAPDDQRAALLRFLQTL
jgi:CxxC motif-containing protein (DUF1111 family)